MNLERIFKYVNQHQADMNAHGGSSLVDNREEFNDKKYSKSLRLPFSAAIIKTDTHNNKFTYCSLLEPCCYTINLDYVNGNMHKYKFHDHRYHEFLFLESGTMEHIIENGSTRIQKGNICFLDKKICHAERFLSSVNAIYFGFSDSLINQATKSIEKDSSISEFFSKKLQEDLKHRYLSVNAKREEAAALIEPVIEQILWEALLKQEGFNLVVSGLFQRLFACLANKENFKSELILFDTSTNDLAEKLAGYIAKHYGNITRKELENEFHYSADYMNRLIQKHTGLSLSQYANQIRLEKAELLLTTTTLPVNRIAEQLGFQNLTYFYRIFKQKNQMTLQEYRKIKSV